MIYQSSGTHCSKVISKIKVFKKWVKLQRQGHRVKNNGTQEKVLSQGILMWNIKALEFTVQTLLARLKFQREWHNDRQDKNNMPPDLRSRGHKKKTSIFDHHLTSRDEMKIPKSYCTSTRHALSYSRVSFFLSQKWRQSSSDNNFTSESKGKIPKPYWASAKHAQSNTRI